MKKLIISLFFMISLLCFSKEYNIGDKITLQISGKIDKNQIESSLKDYKIDSILKDDEGNFIVTFTTYKVGENEVVLGDKKLKIDVVSTIDESDENIYDALSNPNNQYIENDYPHMGILSLIAGVLIIITGIAMYLIDRAKNPYIIFKKEIEKTDSNNWRENISLSLRKYIDSIFFSNFLGGEYTIISPLTEDDIKFIKELDYLKFSNKKDGDYLEYKSKAIEIVEKIRKEKKNSV